MLGETKKKLIIVVDDKTAKYGELLSALVNSNDDKLDESDNTQIIGVKDGTVQTVIWTDKVFRDNQAQVSSDNRIIFIGKSDVSKNVAANVYTENPFSEYGVYYGNLSNKAVIYAEKKVLAWNSSLYDKFFDSYSEFINSLDIESANNMNLEKRTKAMEMVSNKTEEVSDTVANAVNQTTVSDSEAGKKFKFPKFSKNFVKGAAAVATALSGGAVLGVAKAKSDKEIEDQQYRCAVFAYYIYQLASFME